MYAYVDAANVSNLVKNEKANKFLISVTACKKDHSRTDYRKADKMRPGIWYLILAVAYLLISIWSLYFVCTMYSAVRITLCQSAIYIDTIN